MKLVGYVHDLDCGHIFTGTAYAKPYETVHLKYAVNLSYSSIKLGRTSAGKGCGRQAVTGHDVGAQKGVVSLSREVIFAELGKVDTHLSEMLQRQNRVQRLSEGWEV